MVDLNYSLRIAYYSALNTLGVPVYYQSLPPTVNPENYILFRSISNTDSSTKDSADTSTTITIEIHTKTDQTNRGLNADTMARDVYNRIYPNKHDNLSISGGQILSTTIVSDDVQNFQINANEAYISRYITFKHIIYQSSDIS
jgi:hypothetical protein